MTGRKTALAALGGNALLKPDEPPTLDAQWRNARAAARALARLARGRRIVVTHGNGPQVGLAIERAESMDAEDLTLDAAVAQTEGELGYVLQQALQNAMRAQAVTLLTQVVVSARDPAFRNPTKPIGAVVKGREVSRLRRGGHDVTRVDGGWRRVVASPAPKRIVERDAIRHLVDDGFLVIAAGGGGIPVVERKSGLAGVEAVVDKDLASACLARDVGAVELFLLTDVDGVYTGFGTKRARKLRRLDAVEARRLGDEGEFPEGSMGPKVQAAVEFVERTPHGRAVIGSLTRPLEGTVITVR